ncbi:DEAD/DEAH box helicase [Plebeiibacterium marinum]|uniref:DEAD/DEAH box helicase n=1 Tax=Plebeiibacterium marinum TaxID=2992111 RepID=A0AAE3MGG5_9BACT|nr:DEAD/DEAH box helicase [Plebeiobacterium marinum]MCW3807543.1 DEAD/DEAH box helicase [Plebeiobacterium marinum]
MKQFEKLGIDKKFCKAIKELNIIEPTEIQQQVIPILMQNNTDLVGQAQTGTGKTAAYGLPLLHRINPTKKYVQGLILCPTRELGQQIAKQLFKFTKYSDKIFTEAVFGGAPIERQISALKRPTHIIVATPGRLIELVEKKAVDLSYVKTVILDEADEMLSMGFKKELDQILKQLDNIDNKWLFSATMPDGIKKIVNKHLSKRAVKIEVSKKSIVNKNIDHQFLICDESEKLHILLQLLNSEKGNRGIVFCKTKVAATTLAKQLNAKNITTDAIQGDLKQIERDKIMRSFRKGNMQILVATDLAARGINIDNLSFVVHYQLPDKDEYYTHRSGRTARAGNKGYSLCLITSKEIKQIRHFEKALKISFKQLRRAK